MCRMRQREREREIKREGKKFAKVLRALNVFTLKLSLFSHTKTGEHQLDPKQIQYFSSLSLS